MPHRRIKTPEDLGVAHLGLPHTAIVPPKHRIDRAEYGRKLAATEGGIFTQSGYFVPMKTNLGGKPMPTEYTRQRQGRDFVSPKKPKDNRYRNSSLLKQLEWCRADMERNAVPVNGHEPPELKGRGRLWISEPHQTIVLVHLIIPPNLLLRASLLLAGVHKETGVQYITFQALPPITGGRAVLHTQLFAVWQPTTGRITYNENKATSGSPPFPQSVAFGGTLTLSGSNTLARTGLSFYCWNTRADGKGIDYLPGARVTLNANTTDRNGNLLLYAKWRGTVTYIADGSESGTPLVIGYR